MTRALTDLTGRSDWMLRRLFDFAARGLPLTRITETRRPYTAHTGEPAVTAAAAPPDHEAGRPLRRSYGSSGK
jgi:hypothetical protein